MAVALHLERLLIAGLVIDILAIALRCCIRLQQRAFSYDDFVLFISLVGFIIFSSFLLVSLHYGYGGEIQPAPGYYDQTLAIKYFFIAQPTYVLTSAFVKTGVALVLFRVNINRRIRHILLVSMAIVFTVILVFFFLLIFQCRPISLNWGVGTGKCFEYATIRRAGIALSVADIASNWLYSLLPVAMVYKVQMRWTLKAAVIFLLGLGVVSSIATAVRFQYILKVSDRHKTLAKTKEIDNNLLVLLWSHLELFLAILASSLVALRPLFKRVGEMIHSSGSKHSTGPRREESQPEHERNKSHSRVHSMEEAADFHSEVSLVRLQSSTVLAPIK